MARRRQAEPVRPEGVPAPLTDHQHPVWHDPDAVAQLFMDYRLEPKAGYGSTSSETTPWWSRFDAFRSAWCLANGLNHPQWPHLIDYQRAREAGVDMHSTSRYRLRADRGEASAAPGA
ncbi:MAG: hypothetical protein ACTMIR_13360 [Cellulomonadaceae bacterium]